MGSQVSNFKLHLRSCATGLHNQFLGRPLFALSSPILLGPSRKSRRIHPTSKQSLLVSARRYGSVWVAPGKARVEAIPAQPEQLSLVSLFFLCFPFLLLPTSRELPFWLSLFSVPS